MTVSWAIQSTNLGPSAAHPQQRWHGLFFPSHTCPVLNAWRRMVNLAPTSRNLFTRKVVTARLTWPLLELSFDFSEVPPNGRVVMLDRAWAFHQDQHAVS